MRRKYPLLALTAAMSFAAVSAPAAGDNLANAKNVDLNSIQIVFAFRERDKDGSGEFQTRPFVPTFNKCVEGKVYGPIVVSDNGG